MSRTGAIQKPNVLVVADFPDWAYAEVQKFLSGQLSGDFNFYSDYLIFNTKKKSKNPLNWLKHHFLQKKHQRLKSDGQYDLAIYLGFYFTDHMKITWSARKVLKGVYTEGFPPQNGLAVKTMSDFKLNYLNDCDGLICGTKKIQSTFKSSGLNTYCIPILRDFKLFSRKTIKKKNDSTRFVVGWTGNPKRPFKGFYTHIIPAIEILQKQYPSLEFKTRFSGPIESLPDFYSDVDVVLIASDADAGPSLFSEASLMEVPSISTSIGKPFEIIENGRNGYLVKKEINEMVLKVAELYEDRDLLFSMSKCIRNDFLEAFDEKKVVNSWREAISEVLN